MRDSREHLYIYNFIHRSNKTKKTYMQTRDKENRKEIQLLKSEIASVAYGMLTTGGQSNEADIVSLVSHRHCLL